MNGYRTTPAECWVDDLGGDGGDGSGVHWWRVHVRTPVFWPGKPYYRVYRLQAFADNLAASEGLRRFAEEVDGRPPIIMEP